MARIEIADLGKTFGTTRVLRNLDLTIEGGAFVVILGASGCGKSTLLRCIAGLESTDHGTIRIDGCDVAGLEPRDRGCAMVFQNYALYPHMSVENNIGYALRVARVPRSARRERVRAAARLVELEDLLGRKPAQLSGGQRQRVAMARAVVREPAVFLFDEPLSNLDAKLRVQMRQELRAIHDRIGATSILVTHDQVEGLTLADRLVVLNEGRIEQSGPPAEVYDRPASTYVARFLGAPGMNLVPVVARRGEVELPDGTHLALDMAGPEEGDDLVLGIRPEEVRFADGAAPGVPVSATLESREELGGMRLYHMRLSGLPFAVMSPRRHDAGPGSAIGLHLPVAALHVFAAADGKRREDCRLSLRATAGPADRVETVKT